MSSYLADAHREWHTVHGQNAVCPLDCGAGESYDPLDYMTEEELAEHEAWAEAEAAKREAVTEDPWTGVEFDPPF